MKKLLTVLLAAALVCGGLFTSCKQNSDDDDGTPASTSPALSITGDAISVTVGGDISETITGTITNDSFATGVTAAAGDDLSAYVALSDASFLAAGYTITAAEAIAAGATTAKITVAGTAAATAATGTFTVTIKAAALTSAKDLTSSNTISYEVKAASSGATATTASWIFSDLSSVACEAANAATAFTDNASLQAAATAWTTFGGTAEGKFSIKADVSYTASTGTGTMTVKSLGADGATPILYNKYEASKAVGTGSAGCLQVKDDSLVIANVQGPCTITVPVSANGSSDKTDRHAYIKINGTEKATSGSGSSVATAGEVVTYDYTGSDSVTVIVGATNLVRVFDVKIVAD